jgi:hypothetical protein
MRRSDLKFKIKDSKLKKEEEENLPRRTRRAQSRGLETKRDLWKRVFLRVLRVFAVKKIITRTFF